MSTRAEIKRQKELKRKISLCFKAIAVVVLLAIGVVYYLGNQEESGAPDGADTFDVGAVKPSESKSYVKQSNALNSSGKQSDSSILSGTESVEPKSSSINKSSDSKSANNASSDKTIDDYSLVNDGDDNSEDYNVDTKSDNKDVETISHYTDDGKLNINLATSSELCTLDGIGEKRAMDIIEYRETYGGFKSIEDIMKVKGIKQGIYKKIKDSISCG